MYACYNVADVFDSILVESTLDSGIPLSSLKVSMASMANKHDMPLLR